jgi:hypothetical protein
MGKIYKNFKTVVYCVAQWADKVSEEQLRKEIEFFQKYVGVEKIYLETFRGTFARKEQIQMIKRVMEEHGIEVAGGITTVTPNLNDEDKKRQRLFETFCYCNEPMRNRLKEVSEYTASLFDEFIIDDFFFTQCMCEDCLKEKGSKSWEEFRLAKMLEVSENLVIGPAKKVNPNVKITIKYPNWRESFQETGYNPQDQREIFDFVYTGTETRHGAQQDQHLPRYLSYSLPQWVENVAPGRNGGGWFDPFECDRIDTYLEQAYLTAFGKCKEIMMFCWSALYNNKRATPLMFQYKKLDKIMGECGKPFGLPVYIPFNSQGEDHIEDFLGMVGIPMEPTPNFPNFGKGACECKSTSADECASVGAGSGDGSAGSGDFVAVENSGDFTNSVLVTAASLKDDQIVAKIKKFVEKGGKVLATSGFMIGALKKYPEIKDLTGVRYNEKTLEADEFQFDSFNFYGRNFVLAKSLLKFPLLEHRNNASWSIVNAGHGEYHESLVMYDTYGKGKFEIINLPEMPSRIKDLPTEVLCVMRKEMLGSGKVWIDCGYGVSLFTYDNNTFGLYCYTNDGCAPLEFNVHIAGKPCKLEKIADAEEMNPWWKKDVNALYSNDKETVFPVRILPGDFVFFKIV